MKLLTKIEFDSLNLLDEILKLIIIYKYIAKHFSEPQINKHIIKKVDIIL